MSQQDSSAWKWETTIPSDTAIGSELVNGLMEAMGQRGWSPTEMFRVQLAYEEAIVNAIRHGNQFAEDKTVDVRMHCDLEQVIIEITDMGSGFDPSTIPDPREDDRLEVPGGRGVMLIHELMTHVHYNDCGNQVTMKKVRGEDAELSDEPEGESEAVDE
jgi:serine/threonine-protein kinase RsbW